MAQIRPISDLRNKFTDISKAVHESSEPVILTKNGYGNMVVMSYEAYENLEFESELYFRLKQAESEAEQTDVRYSHESVMKEAYKVLEDNLK